jgi:colicin import membrane protein
MRGPSLQKTTIVSFTLHLIAFLIVLLIVRQSGRIIIPPPYTVNLVSPEISRSFDKGSDSKPSTSRVPRESPPAKTTPKKKTKEELIAKKDTVKEQNMIEEKISLIKAKKQVEKTVRLRSVINLKASDFEEKSHLQATSAQTGTRSSNLFNEYYAQMQSMIWQQWSWPETGQKDLLAIISIKILKDGTIRIQKIEKSSGNSFFDKEALKALTKANPLPPPPDELEVSLRFYP